ncbi:hypothetical protein [Hyphomonas sp.]|uniref:hypothetical protein n=1 Tax=Hyphomonas sp. TaxID=87 RepID=UPI003918AF08
MRSLTLIPMVLLVLAACSPAEAPVPAAESAGVAAPAAPAGAAPGELDPGSLDLSQIALAMRIPEAFQAREAGAYLQIVVTNDRLGVDIAEDFPMVTTQDVASPALAAEARPGYRIWTYGLRAEDAPRLNAISAELSRLRAEAPGENELSFGAVAAGCWNEPEATPESLRRTLYIRIAPEGDFQVFVPEEDYAPGALPGLDSFWAACG